MSPRDQKKMQWHIIYVSLKPTKTIMTFHVLKEVSTSKYLHNIGIRKTKIAWLERKEK